jgi:hypothetical protein
MLSQSEIRQTTYTQWLADVQSSQRTVPRDKARDAYSSICLKYPSGRKFQSTGQDLGTSGGIPAA